MERNGLGSRLQPSNGAGLVKNNVLANRVESRGPQLPLLGHPPLHLLQQAGEF